MNPLGFGPARVAPGGGFDFAPIRIMSPPIQRKATVSSPGDPYERQADEVADRVMRRAEASGPRFDFAKIPITNSKPLAQPVASPPSLQRKADTSCACNASEEDALPGQVMRAASHPEAGANTGQTSAARPAGAIRALGSGRTLTHAERAYFEPSFGADFTDVRVHEGQTADLAARGLSARAFTYGNQIALARGQYDFGAVEGRRLLAHELAHVVQGGGKLGRAETEDRPSVCSGLTDIETDIDNFVKAAITAARSAPGVTPLVPFLIEVGDRTGGGGPVGPVETFVEGLPATKRFLPPANLAGTRYSSLSSAALTIPSIMGMNIYDAQRLGFAHVVGATALIHGQCVGADKLGHMFQQGLQYFAIRSGAGRTAADAESFGRATEIERAGLGATGVYSNADLAANRTGMQFWDDLGANPAHYTFGIARYIRPDWNEYNNPNFYENSVAREVWARQLTGSWSGTRVLGGPHPTTEAVNMTLTATNTGAVTGTFTLPGRGTGTGTATTGTISGTLTFRTTSVSGTIPSTVLHGSAGSHSATPVSGVSLPFDWVFGTSRGKGLFLSIGETRLGGTFGNGTSTTDAGQWTVSRP
jgi:hypothetical protein